MRRCTRLMRARTTKKGRRFISDGWIDGRSEGMTDEDISTGSSYLQSVAAFLVKEEVHCTVAGRRSAKALPGRCSGRPRLHRSPGGACNESRSIL